MATVKEGYLVKNHAGREFREAHNKRWFESNGFHVRYFKDQDKKSLKGHFDLRNVQGIQLFTHDNPKQIESAGKDAIMMKIVEMNKKGQPMSDKVMIISFLDQPAARDGWLKLWCSAIEAKHVNPVLKPYIDGTLADALNSQFAETGGISRTRSLMKKKITTTAVLTPRSSVTVSAVAAGTIEANFDTPRVPSATLSAPLSPESEAAAQPEATPDASQVPPAAVPPPSAPAPESTSKPDDSTDTAEPAPLAEETTFEITVPEGVSPGDRLQATTPSGVKVKLVVPQGAEAGMLLTFQVPKVDGKKKKKKAEGEAEGNSVAKAATETPPPDNGEAVAGGAATGAAEAASGPAKEEAAAGPPTVPKPAMVEDEAAVKLQSSFRGLKTRDSRQEAARLQWFNYYMQPEVADWDEAEKMAVTDGELAAVAAARAAAGDKAAPEHPEEQRRLQWFKHYLTSWKFAEADELVATKEEKAQVVKAKAMAASQCCSCLPNKGEIERDRQSKFMIAIKSYEWDVAEILAMAPDEVQDVAHSRMRYSQLKEAIGRRDFALARQYMITKDEQEMVHMAESTAPPPKTDGMSDADAALKVQSILRGHQARDAQEELRRVEWLKYYQGLAQYDKALELAVTPAEVAEIKEMQAKAMPPPPAAAVPVPEPVAKPAPEPELKPYPEPVPEPVPTPTAAAADTAAAPAPEAPPTEGKAKGAEKADTFEAAVTRYDWETAAKLAETEADHSDLADSKARVEWLERYLEQGQHDKAKGLAITEAEVERIQAAAAAAVAPA